jgi:hypothetical protein
MNKSKKSATDPIYQGLVPVPSDIGNTEEFLEYARWTSLPSWERDPENQKDFADQIGVSEDELNDWRQHPGFHPLVRKFASEWILNRLPDIVGELFEKIAAGRGNTKDVELYYRLYGVIHPGDDAREENEN